MANVISDETMEYVGILAKLELSKEGASRIPVSLTPVALRTAKRMRPRAARMKTPGTMRTRRYPLCRR